MIIHSEKIREAQEKVNQIRENNKKLAEERAIKVKEFEDARKAIKAEELENARKLTAANQKEDDDDGDGDGDDKSKKLITKNSEENIYSFCHLDPKYIKLKNAMGKYSNEKLINFLKIVSDKSNSKIDWKRNRRIARVALSMTLNERGIAPEFRDAKSGVTNKVSKSIEEKEESNDRQIIDLHWIYLHHIDEISPTDWNEPYFSKSEFDFEWALEFVTIARPTNTKIKRLGIPIKIQKLLLSLRGQDVLAQQKRARAIIADIRELIVNKLSEPKSRLPKDKLDAICAAIRCLELANGSPTDAVDYWKKMPLNLTQQSPKIILPWMKSRKVIWLKLLDEMKRLKSDHKGRDAGVGTVKGIPAAVAQEPDGV